MPSMRVRGSWPTVFTILLLFFFASAVHSANDTAPYPANPANSTAPHPAKGTAPSCNAKLKFTLKITEVPNPHRVRREEKPPGGNPGHIAPRCNVKTNSTIKITEITDPHRVVRREEKPPGENGAKVAPRCKAKFNSTVSAGNAGNETAIKVGRIRRADKPPASSSSEFDSNESEGAEGSGQNLPSNAPHSDSDSISAVPLAPFIEQGALPASYMRASEQAVAADLVKKGKLRPGERIASQFTDVSAFKSNGWKETDGHRDARGVVMEWYVPFPNALRSLGISDTPRPQGKQEQQNYEHTLPWMRNGQSMKVSR